MPRDNRESLMRALLLQHLDQHIRTHGRSPSVYELKWMYGLGATDGIQRQMDGLERDGLIMKDRKKGRGWRISPKGALALDELLC